MFKKMQMRLLSFLLTIAMVLGMMPVSALAKGTRNGEAENVYITISEEGLFVEDTNGNPVVHRAVSLNALKAIDLDTYGLSDYKYDANGDGNYETTALHLYIYAHEQLLGLEWGSVDCSNGSPGSMYFSSDLFGFADENMRYNYNGAYPADENGWGLTADRIVLSAGDFFDVAHFSDWQFYSDSAYGFNYFVDANESIVHDFTADAGDEMTAKLILVGGGMGMGESITSQADFTVYYGTSIGQADGTVETDDIGVAAITFPSAGTWYIWCDGGEGIDMCAGSIVSSPVGARVTVTEKEVEQPNPEVPEKPGAVVVEEILNATMEKMAETVTEPTFGTNAGEWTVLSLARGGYYQKDNKYFTDYYDRIVKTVNVNAASVNMNGALHKSKSTDNSRLIVALSSIGKDARYVGDWNLITPYDDFSWIKKQGLNGVIWALIALDSNDYETTDTSIRQQCVEYILNMKLEDGGWNLGGTELDVDITAMTLQALYRYKDQSKVATVAEKAFERLSNEQQESGGFSYGDSETSESAAQVIVACTTWGINPDTDSRFIKDGNSVLDNLLSYYLEDEAMFAHQGTVSNNMATDQACYALVAYDRLLDGKPALYDMSDVTFDESDDEEEETDEMILKLGIPDEISSGEDSIKAVLSINKWDNKAGYKLIDFIMTVPEGVNVKKVNPGSRLNGGEVQFHLEEDTGKLRVVYFDANENKDITMSGSNYPAELFTVTFEIGEIEEECLDFAVTGMSVKLSSDSNAENSMIIVNTEKAEGSIDVIESGISINAVCLYTGDDVDLIPSTKKAVAIAVTGVDMENKLIYDDGSNEIEFLYSAEITETTGCISYVALVDSTINMQKFTEFKNYDYKDKEASSILFGDSNGDDVINAQDALAAVDAWLRKGEEPANHEILAMNVNGDSRINTFDALGIVEAFVDHGEFAVVVKAATLDDDEESEED